MTATMIMASVAPDPPSGEIPNIRSIKSIGCLPACICAYAQCDVLAMRPTARLTHRLIGWPSGKCDGPTVAARGQCRRLVIALAQGGLVLTEGQLAAMENATSEKEANGEFESGTTDEAIFEKVVHTNLNGAFFGHSGASRQAALEKSFE